MALSEMNYVEGGGGTDHFQKFLGMGQYDAASSTQTIPEETDFIVIVPIWIPSSSLVGNRLISAGSAYINNSQGELYYLENIGDIATVTKVYQGSDSYEKTTVVTWTSATTITISRTGSTTAGGVLCFYFANKQ